LEIKKTTLSYFAKPHSQNGRQISESMIGSTQKILVSGAAIKHAGQLSGRSENNRVVNFFGGIELIGKLVPVKSQKCCLILTRRIALIHTSI